MAFSSPLSLIVPKIKGVIQIGASWGEETGGDGFANVPYQIYIEPRPDAFNQLASRVKGRLNTWCFKCACADYIGTAQFYLSSNAGGVSSSLLPFMTVNEANYHCVGTIDVEVQTVDNLLKANNINPANFDFMFIDVQGSEWYVIKGAEKTLENINFIWTEVNFEAAYERTILFEDVNKLLEEKGFELKHLEKMPDPKQGEALYVKKEYDYSSIFK